MKKMLFALLLVCSVSVAHDKVQPYLTVDELPDLIKCLPAPPAFDSPEFANDLMRYAWGKQQRQNEARAAIVRRDAVWSYEALIAEFCVPFGLDISEQETPEIWKLLVTSLTTTDAMRVAPKAYYHRLRPFEYMGDHMLVQSEEDELRGEGSYPSGHTHRGYTCALLLAEINPANADTIFARGWMYGESRVINGAHWQSDVDASRVSAAIGYSALHTSPAFLAQMAAARKEFQQKTGQNAKANKQKRSKVPAVGNRSATYVPKAPDYANSAMWFTEDKDTTGNGADIFYVVSTWEKDWMHDGTVCHYADVWNDVHRAHMAIEISRAARYMAPGNRFYAPYYRHTTIDGWVTRNEDTIQHRTRLSMGDVCQAFDRFVAQRDNSRPLIIAGFSQGGMAVVELLKYISDETYSRLAAAYVMGYKLTPQDTLCPHIRPAHGETDTGVAICYNTVKDVRYIQPVIAASCACINPVNWRTDATPAVLHDTITVTVAPEHVLVVSGYSGAEYQPYANFINVGDIHSCEPWLYSECIRRNMQKRIESFRQKQ